MRRAHRFTILCFAALLGLATLGLAQGEADWLRWSAGPSLPDSLGVGGAFVGAAQGAVIVAGGSNFPLPGGSKTYRDTIYVLAPEGSGGRWRQAGKLPIAAAHGAAVSTPAGLLCLGGENDRGPLRDVFLLKWDASKRIVTVDHRPPDLPMACSYLSSAQSGSTVYVAGGKGARGELTSFWAMGGSANRRSPWQQLAPWPGPPRFGALLTAQHDGRQPGLYLFSGKHGRDYLTDGYRYTPATRSWTATAPLRRAALLAPIAAVGQSHILVFSGSDGHDVDRWRELGSQYCFPADVLAYHTITDTWAQVGRLPVGVVGTTAVPWGKGFILPSGEIRPTVRTPCAQLVRVVSASRSFGPLDYAALVTYLAALLLIGAHFSAREKTTDDFFLAGHRIPWWAAGLSLMATQVSSIGFMAVPAKSFATDWVYFAGVITWFAVVPIVTRVFIPLFRRLNVTTAYEYLEGRFDVKVRCFSALVFSLMQLGRMAVVLYLPAAALSAVTGLSPHTSILIMGVLATAYTVAGGMEAVIWTDVIQAVVLVGGALLCIAAVVFGIDGGLGQFVRVALDDDKLRVANLSWDFATAALWVVLVGNVFTRLAGLTADQAVVQRYLTTQDAKQSARALWLDVAVSIPWAIIVFGLGTALYVFYKTHPELLAPGSKTIEAVPLFVAQCLPSGLSGLIIAAIFAAAMSSLDSSMHSVATTWTTDFYARLSATVSDRHRLRFARALTIVLGLFGTATALWIASAEVKSLWDLFIKIMGLFTGGLSGLFILGLITTRTGALAALVGALASVAAMVLVWRFRLVHPLLYTAVGVVVCLFVGYAASFVPHSGRKD